MGEVRVGVGGLPGCGGRLWFVQPVQKRAPRSAWLVPAAAAHLCCALPRPFIALAEEGEKKKKKKKKEKA